MRELRTTEANMGLYYLLLRLWLPLGLSESVVRLLTALIGIATIPVIYALGARLFGRRAGLMAALVLALDPFHLGLSQDARSYPFAIFLVVCSMWAFTHVVNDSARGDAGEAACSTGQMMRTWAWRAGYVITSAAAVYAHFYAALVLFAEWASLVGRPRRDTRWRAVIASGIAAVLLLTPLLAFLLRGRHTNIDWIAGEVPYVIAHLWENAQTPMGLVAALYAVVLVGLIWSAWRAMRSRASERDAWPYVLVLMWLGAPVIIPVVFSVIVKPVFDIRYASVSLPAVGLLAGALAEGLSSRRVIAMLAVIGAVEAGGDWVYFTRVHKEDWRGATLWILATAAPGDAAVFYAPYTRRPYEYYVDRFGQRAVDPRVLYPSLAYVTFGKAVSAASPLTGALVRAAQSATRTWLIVSHARADAGCEDALNAALHEVYRAVERYPFTDIDVWLYSERSVPAGTTFGSGPTPAALAAVRRRCPQA